MKKVLTFGASTSRKSINKQLAFWAGEQVGVEHIHIDLNDFEMPIYSIDRERENGIPDHAKRFKKLLEDADGVLISFAEHNGAYTAAFKNIFDWMSRLGNPRWSNKPMFLMSTSPGGRGAKSVLGIALNSFPHQGGNVVASFSLPKFGENFDNGITDTDLKKAFDVQVDAFKSAL